MSMRINQKLLSRLSPAEKAYEVRDDKLIGFIVRVQPSGAKSFYVEWARGKRMCIGSTSKYLPQAARERAQEILSASIGGRNPIAELKQRQPMTLQRFVEDHYRPWAQQSMSRGDNAANRILSRFEAFAKDPLADITKQQIERWMTERSADGVKPATIKRDVAGLKAMLTR